MYCTVYQTTNVVDGKVYIGAHQTKTLDDGYLGSGKHLVRAIQKYSAERFEKKILFVFDNVTEMFDKETDIVNEAFVKRKDTYNLKVGGSGGNPGIVGAFTGRKHTTETKNKIRAAALTQGCTENTKNKMSESAKNRNAPSLDTREKLSVAASTRQHTDATKQKLSNMSKGRKRVYRDDGTYSYRNIGSLV